MYVLTMPNGRPLVVDDREVPSEPRTACERVYTEFLAEHAVRWQSRFPLLEVHEQE